ncbi:hypothetical protein CDL15_Pgr026111 [Punica granatum]|uniref:Cytochrome f n=1 Tax=Punica granatum TaxID=22663 RepID=A0A218WDI5_PUNGR|nr:hypothetical protein CDL15_Pgr026111 [Punica granatum]
MRAWTASNTASDSDTDASNGRQVVDIIPQDSNFFVSAGESIKLDWPLTSNPNVGGFGQGDAEIVLQDPFRVQGLLFFLASIILAQIFLVLKKKQFEKQGKRNATWRFMSGHEWIQVRMSGAESGRVRAGCLLLHPTPSPATAAPATMASGPSFFKPFLTPPFVFLGKRGTFYGLAGGCSGPAHQPCPHSPGIQHTGFLLRSPAIMSSEVFPEVSDHLAYLPYSLLLPSDLLPESFENSLEIITEELLGNVRNRD